MNTDRLERLERKYTQLKRWNMILGATLILVVGGAWQAEDNGILKVKKLIIEDEKGRARITLQIVENGPHLIFTGENGLPRLVMGVGNSSPRNPKEQVFFNMRDDQAAPKLLMGIDSNSIIPKPHSYMNLRDEEGKVIFSAPPPRPKPPVTTKPEPGPITE